MKILLTILAVIFWPVLAQPEGLIPEILDLATAQKIALAENPSLDAAVQRVVQAEERLQQSRAAYWPSVDFESVASYANIAENERLRSMVPDSSVENYSASVTASWLVFDGFGRKFRNLQAESGALSLGQARLDGQRLLLQAIAESYYSGQLARYNYQIAQADLEFNQRLLQEAEVSNQAGAGSLSSVLNFKVKMNQARSSILLTKQNQQLAMLGLATLMGLGGDGLPTGTRLAELTMVPEAEYQEPELVSLIDKALVQRPDLAKANHGLEQAKQAVGIAKAAYYPQVALSASVSGLRSGDPGFEGDDLGSSVALRLSYNLFHGTADKARIAEAKAYRYESSYNLASVQLQICSEVKEAVTKLLQAQEQLKLQKISTDLVMQTRDLVQEGYVAGQESLVRLNEAQLDLVRTQSNLAVSLVTLYRNRHLLKTATGDSLGLVGY